jgi:uncharacterized cupredoxin-like copper-binding protein
MKLDCKVSALPAVLLVVLAYLPAATTLAHGDMAHKGPTVAVVKEQTAWGIAGDRSAVDRTITSAMLDKMRFTPERIEVKQGETIRFVLKNSGKLMHEFVIGTREELDAHAALMKKFPNMEHDQPYMAHVAPGKSGEIIWTFNKSGEFNFACLISGHYEAGMIGTIKVVAK